jgi:hypothetical protein
MLLRRGTRGRAGTKFLTSIFDRLHDRVVERSFAE